MNRPLGMALLIALSAIVASCGGGGGNDSVGSTSAYAGTWTETTTNSPNGPGTSITIDANGDASCKFLGNASNCTLTSRNLDVGTYTFANFQIVLNAANGTFTGTFANNGETLGNWTGVLSGFKSTTLSKYQGTWSEAGGVGTAVTFGADGYITCKFNGAVYPCNLYGVDLTQNLFKFQDLRNSSRYSMTLNVSAGTFAGKYPNPGDVGENWTGTFNGTRL